MPQQESVGVEPSKVSPGYIVLGIAFLVVGVFAALIEVTVTATASTVFPWVGVGLILIGIVFVVLELLYWLE